jgi:signal transduction histidine kinase
MEDDAGLARLLQKRLTRHGFRVEIASDGINGLSMAQKTPYDILLVDQKMPGMSGIEVLRQMAAIGRMPPSVMITGAGDERIAVEAMKLGAADYIIKDAAGGFLALIPAVLDRVLAQRRMAEQNRQMEAELRKVEKLKAIGNMAGGIAHDFNNLLTVILGYINMAASDDALPAHLGGMIRKAETATLQARDLTHQFITFSSTEYPDLRPMPAPQLVTDAARLSLSGGRVKLECRFPPDPWHVVADPGHIRQVINNLVTNAKEAMPEGGVVRIEGRNLIIQPDTDPNRLPLQPGRYLRIDITDQGRGIPREDLEKVLDPYFSTKERGPQKGMGFGLSTAYFILQKHGGYLSIASEVGKGTTASVYLPAVQEGEDARPVHSPSETALPPRRLLLMDDEKMVLQVSGQMLRRLGHEVLFAEDGREAVDRVEEAVRAGTPLDGVILDLTIRDGMGGKEAMAKIRRIQPDIRAIVSSGYAEDPVMQDAGNFGFDAALPKPYDKAEMAAVLSAVFDSQGKRQPAPSDPEDGP